MVVENVMNKPIYGEANNFDKFANYISLGYFCEVAKDLECLGLRNQSSPFDWGISYFPNVMDAIENEFDGFLAFENLSQSVFARGYYREDKYNFYFYHDFDKYISLNKQYEKVKTKYWRRIGRFLQTIKEPTLFIRYISSEEQNENNRSVELEWIEANYPYILSVLKKYNSNNEIIFIGDESVVSDIIKVYHVQKDPGDTVSRRPIFNNTELLPLLSSFAFPGRESNMKRAQKKYKRQNNIFSRVKQKFMVKFGSHFYKEYLHEKTYGTLDK